MICPLLEGGYGTVKIYRGPWIFTTGGSIRIARGEHLLVWRHARGQGEMLSPDVPAEMPTGE